jgi:hypothetical protein
MASWRPSTRTTRPHGDGGRGDGGPPDADRVSRARWLGVALVVLALVSAILMAATAPLPDPSSVGAVASSADPDGTDPVDATASPPPDQPDGEVPQEVPVLVPPEATRTRERSIDLLVTVPETRLRPRDLRLHVLRGDRVMADVRATRGEVAVTEIRLRLGDNVLTAALVGPGGMGPRSEPITVTVDREAPAVRIEAPRNGQSVQGASVNVRGTTEPGALVTITNRGHGGPYSLTAGPDGAFRASVALATGGNRITVRVEDDLGNARTADLRVVRGRFEATARLRLRPRELRLARLPARLTITLVVRSTQGDPVARAPVVFSLGPFGQSVDTFETTTDRDGRAVWVKNIPRDGARRGVGKVTATVTLPDGRSIVARADLEFT